MATNQVYMEGDELLVAVVSGTVSGSPVIVGTAIPGVAQADRDANGNAPVDFDGVYNLSVKGIDGSGNHAVALGDILYYTSGDTPPLSVKATGVRFGYALAVVTSGSTATIAVKIGY